MRRDEEPGFRPGRLPERCPANARTITGVEALVDEWHLSAADERRLRSEGFISLTSQPIRGPGSAGVSEVSLYATAQGAERSLAHELRPDVIRAAGPVEDLRFFSVPGIPGARGWTASLPASRRAAASGTSSGCRVGACTSSGTRAPVPSPARCRRARGRSMSARATSARARSRPGHRGARACERPSPCRSRSPSHSLSSRSPAAAMTPTAGPTSPAIGARGASARRPGAPGRAGARVIRCGCRRPVARPAGSPRTDARSRIAA